MGVAFTARSGSGMVIENTVPSCVRHCLADHALTARAPRHWHRGGEFPVRLVHAETASLAKQGRRLRSFAVAELDGLPLGLSLNGPPGADVQLLRLARSQMPEAA